MSEYIGDFAEDATIETKFNTRGTFAGSPAFAVYKGNSVTEITAGITPTIDFDGVANFHQIVIDLSSDAAYAAGEDYTIVVTSGTVGGESAVGQIVRTFSIENRSVPSVSLGTNAPADWINAASIAAGALDGKGNWNVGKTDYGLSAGERTTLAGVIDSTLLDAGDATDLIASIVTRIGNTNVDQAAFVAAVKAALFDAGSAANKLAVDASGRITVGTNADKTGYALNPTTGLGNQTANITGSIGSVTDPVTVGTNNDKSGYALSQSFPTNFASLAINASGHVSRVTLVDTTTTNTDVTALTANYNATRAGYLDKLNVSGTIAHSDAANTYKATGFAVAGDAMTLTSGEREATAVVVESHLLDEGDSQMLINAIVGAIGNTNIDQAVLIAAIRADLERSGGNLNTLITRIAGTIRTAADDVTAEAAQTAAIRDGLALEATAQSIKAKTDGLTFTVENQVDVNVKSYNGTPQSNGDLPLKIDAVKNVVDSIVAKTDNLPESPAATSDVQVTVEPEITVNPTELSSESVGEIRDGLATLAKQEEILGAIGDIEGGGGLTGDYTLTVTVTDVADDEPIEGATVTLFRSGERGAESTDANGEAVFGVDAATWTWIVRASGYTSQTGTKVIAANDTLAVELVAIVVEVPTNPAKSALHVLCVDEDGEPEVGVAVDIRIIKVPSGSTDIAFKASKQTANSDANGTASFEAYKNATYQIKRGKADEWETITISSGDTTSVTSFIGAP
jgi:hypothetical protein